jgi:hypothetical protein
MSDSLSFSLLDAVTLAGNRARPNDDRWGMSGRRAWVIDGATGLGETIMPGGSDAAWIAQRASEAMTRHAAIADTRTMMAAVADDLAAAFRAEQLRAPIADWEVPCASFMMATLHDDGLELVGLGDCRGILSGPDGAITTLGADRTSEAREAAFAARHHQTGNEPRYRSHEALEALRAARSRFAAADGDFILVPDRMFLPSLRPVGWPAVEGAELLLMTDGFAALELRYGAIDAAALVAAARSDGLAALAGHLRHIETMDDPAGEKFPRWKRSDDATALHLAIGV